MGLLSKLRNAFAHAERRLEPARGEALSVSWMPRELPAGEWPPALRENVVVALSSAVNEILGSGGYTGLSELYQDCTSVLPRILVDKSDIDRAAKVYSFIFILLWRQTKGLAALREFNACAAIPFSDFVSRVGEREPARPVVNEVPRVAFLTETTTLLNANAIGRITISLILGFQQVRAPADWPMVYCINDPLPDFVAFAAAHGIVLRSLSSGTQEATAAAIVDQARIDGVDVMVADTNCAVATIAFQRRAARVQCFHENGFAPWAISELDATFFGVTQEMAGTTGPNTRHYRSARNTAFIFQKIDRPAADVAQFLASLKERSGIAEPSTIFGVYGRMPKITPEYIDGVEAVLDSSASAIFFAGGSGDASALLAAKAVSRHGDRIVIENSFVDGHLVSAAIDVFLDTFPFPGGMSCVEAQAHGVPVVWRGGTFEAEFAIVADQRDPDLRAADARGYVDLALSLESPVVRAKRAEAAIRLAQRFGDMKDQATDVDARLSELWAVAREAA